MAITSERKYLFDKNNFDLPDVPEVDEDVPPPPPVFSLEDIGMAQEESFSQGRLTGLEEAAESRAQYIASQFETLARDLKGIVLAEKMRDRVYENEVTGLCEAIFARAFPELNLQHGMSEVLQIIRNAIAAQDKARLSIEVPQGEQAEIEAELRKLPEFDAERISLRESADLSRGSCRIAWQNGGALRNHNDIAARIAAELAGEKLQPLAPETQKDDTEATPPNEGDE